MLREVVREVKINEARSSDSIFIGWEYRLQFTTNIQTDQLTLAHWRASWKLNWDKVFTYGRHNSSFYCCEVGKKYRGKKKFQCDFSKWGLVLHSSLMHLSEEVYWNYRRDWLLRFNSDFYLILRFYFVGKRVIDREKKLKKGLLDWKCINSCQHCVALGCQHDNTTKLTVYARFLLRSDTRCTWLNWGT